MEAGIEHLGRATAKAVDKLIIVVEPGRRSVDSAYRVDKLAKDIGLENIAVVGNKVRNPEDREFMASSLVGFEFLGFIPYDQAIVDADMAGLSFLDASQQVNQAVRDIYQALLTTSATGAR
jgi:CO dehydrogenase maturation factor